MRDSSPIIMAFSAIFWLIAAYFLYSGFALQTDVPNPYPTPGLEQVANFQLMHIQTLNFLTGIGAAIVAAVLNAAAAIVSAISGSAASR